MIPIGRAIKLIRLQRCMTQKQLADAAGFERTYVCRVELEMIECPALRIIERFAAAFNEPTWKLIRYAERMELYENTSAKTKNEVSTTVH
jgi:transcriptional regulator with XRE-family HTH domain